MRATVLCYLFSFLSFGLGSSKVMLINKAIIEQVTTYDISFDLFLATSLYVITIF